MTSPSSQPGAPFFDDLQVGQVFESAPPMTLSCGLAATHQSILGDRLRLALDNELAAAVVGTTAPLAHPALVCDVAIGQSTVVTQRVKANLFYRGLTFHRYPVIGDTLSTRTEIVALRHNSTKPGRASTGVAAMRMTTSDQVGRVVLDFYRCAMLPCRGSTPAAGHAADLGVVGRDPHPVPDPTADWDDCAYRAKVGAPVFDPSLIGVTLTGSADVVSSAPELARLTLNIAATHHDHRINGRRLVYGGHTIGLALAQATRRIPELVTVLSWRSCDHTGPVYEGDTLYSQVHVEHAAPRSCGRGAVLTLRSLVFAAPEGAEPERQVLDWRFTALHF